MTEHGKSFHFDPPKQDRRFMRHRQTGDLGWLVRRNGEDHVKYDRAGVDQTEKVTLGVDGLPTTWVPVNKPAPLNIYQVVTVAYEADRNICRYLGQVNPRKAWIDIDEEKRRDFLERGPDMPGIRNELFAAIMKVGEKYTK